MNNTPNSTAGAAPSSAPRTRSSAVLREILTKNPGVSSFSVERILAAIGHDRAEASLMMFSLPAIVPVPAPTGIVAVPTGAIGLQLLAGHKQIKLPSFVLKKSVSRRSLEVAIHAIAPILEAAERVVRPRWSWVSHPIARRAIGLFVFLLALAIAYPLFEFKALHAMSVFALSVGMAEQDGLAVLIGLVAGVVSLTMVAAFGVSSKAVRVKVQKTLRKVLRKLRSSFIGRFLEKLGFTRLARMLTTEWSELLLLWNPAKREADRAARAATAARAPGATTSAAGVDRGVVRTRPPAASQVRPPAVGGARPPVVNRPQGSSATRPARTAPMPPHALPSRTGKVLRVVQA